MYWTSRINSEVRLKVPTVDNRPIFAPNFIRRISGCYFRIWKYIFFFSGIKLYYLALRLLFNQVIFESFSGNISKKAFNSLRFWFYMKSRLIRCTVPSSVYYWSWSIEFVTLVWNNAKSSNPTIKSNLSGSFSAFGKIRHESFCEISQSVLLKFRNEQIFVLKQMFPLLPFSLALRIFKIRACKYTLPMVGDDNFWCI